MHESPGVVVPLGEVDPRTASDAHLATAWAAGDRLALGEAYRRNAPLLFGVTACLLDDRTAAADVVHDAFVRAASRVSGLATPARLRIWLLAVVRNEAAHRRRPDAEPGLPALAPATWRPEHELPGAPTPTAAVGDRGAASDRGHEVLRAAAAALSDRDRELVELTARGIGDARDLADVLGVPRAQVEKLTADLRRRLEESVAGLLVARFGRAGCSGLAELLATRPPEWTAEVLEVVSGHLGECARCQACRSELAPPRSSVLGPPPQVLLPPQLRDRVAATLASPGGADGTDDAAADGGAAPSPTPGVLRSSWLVDAPPVGVRGPGWGWRPDGFPIQTAHAVRRVADVIADADRPAAARTARPEPSPAPVTPPSAMPAAPRPGGRRRPAPDGARTRVPISGLLLLGIPLLIAGIALVGGFGSTGPSEGKVPTPTVSPAGNAPTRTP